MSECKYEKYFIDYITGELNPNEIIEFQSHLNICTTCPSRLDNLYKAHYAIKNTKRNKPSSDLLTQYHNNLNSMFPQETVHNRWNHKIFEFIESVFWKRSVRYRVAEVFGLVFIGIIIGWILFNSAPVQESKQIIPSDYRPTSVSKAEIEYATYYFQAAELLLMELKNIDVNSSLTRADIEFNKEIAQKLLIKTFIVHEIALKQNDPKLLRFLSKMELLLYEISNTPSEELTQSMNSYAIIIKDSKLLDDARNFQKNIIRYQLPFKQNKKK